MASKKAQKRDTIPTTIQFDREVWEWINAEVADLKKRKPDYSKKDLIQELVKKEMKRREGNGGRTGK